MQIVMLLLNSACMTSPCQGWLSLIILLLAATNLLWALGVGSSLLLGAKHGASARA